MLCVYLLIFSEKKNYIAGSPVMLKNQRFSTVKKNKTFIWCFFSGSTSLK